MKTFRLLFVLAVLGLIATSCGISGEVTRAVLKAKWFEYDAASDPCLFKAKLLPDSLPPFASPALDSLKVRLAQACLVGNIKPAQLFHAPPQFEVVSVQEDEQEVGVAHVYMRIQYYVNPALGEVACWLQYRSLEVHYSPVRGWRVTQDRLRSHHMSCKLGRGVRFEAYHAPWANPGALCFDIYT